MGLYIWRKAADINLEGCFYVKWCARDGMVLLILFEMWPSFANTCFKYSSIWFIFIIVVFFFWEIIFFIKQQGEKGAISKYAWQLRYIEKGIYNWMVKIILVR